MIEEKAKGRWVYFQPNDKDLKDKYGDCTIRALCKALNCTCLEAFDKVLPFMRKSQCLWNSAPQKLVKEWFEQLGFVYHGVSNKSGSKRPTVEDFAKNHPNGTYIVKVAHHQVAVVNGKYYDTWNSGWKTMYGWYELIKNK